MKRFRIVNFLLLALIALAGWRTYEVWRRQAPAAMPSGDEAATAVEPLAPPARNPPVTQLVTVIAEKDLFDPSRQAGGTDTAPMPEQTPAPPPTLKLAGVIVLDGEKEAVFADASQGNKQKRMRIGEEISGYRVQSIDEQNVSLVNGAGEEVRLTLLLEAGKIPPNAFGPGGRPTPRPAPVRATARTAQRAAQAAEPGTQAFGPKPYDPNATATAAEDRERQREEARERAQRARERLKRLRAEAARR
jgi:hypothetical protein